MLRLVLATVLAALPLPAQAIMPFEITGLADVYRVDQVAQTTTFLGTTPFFASGDLAVSGDGNGTMPGDFTYSALFGHITSWDIGFSFVPAVADPFDGLFHAASGGGVFMTGYDTFDSAKLTITSARIWEDDSWPAETFPVIRFGSFVPEPASWAMMIGGLALVGAMIRRREIPLSLSAA
ncbi:MAG: PEPxxWA-CTERM sorting domain-containing protein [Alphaproteobacteria bacterium]|nr:PEPxxWA-CTERM sorting domain-containing protein [Alphaproteobacteria bacterium]MBU0792709.1 PEPxxWA-CTERM sorting domain-containing protein [Alphaproteobacteria bacterium]MBU0877286.1 PEPxxWA-CTERM sorting domain-containing protein [Alphaproteobacteria bacterium]MBU1770539.1 PEPxxWA-CTERM sorting domain-containing protein [Alphaproteobacteria bacterium]